MNHIRSIWSILGLIFESVHWVLLKVRYLEKKIIDENLFSEKRDFSEKYAKG